MPHAETESLGFFFLLFFLLSNEMRCELVSAQRDKCFGCFYARQRLALIRSFVGDVNQRELR